MIDKEYFKGWNYKKHAKLCAAVYLGLFAFDMTVSYPIVKKILAKWEAKEDSEKLEEFEIV